jgi:error-prone DNA polymerase
MIEVVRGGIGDRGSGIRTYFCNTCAHEWTVPTKPVGRFASIEDLVRRTGLRRDELMTLADIGALNAFTNERRSALWQVERAVRPAGELFEEEGAQGTSHKAQGTSHKAQGTRHTVDGPIERSERSERPERPERPERSERSESPLAPMSPSERLHADYAGMGLTIGPHPMALRRDEMALRGVLRAADLPHTRHGRRVRVAGMVITRQRPGTAKGFVFLTLEDETGVANIIVRPDLFDRERVVVIRQPFLLVEGVLQHQDGVISVRAERLQGIEGAASVDAHDFY